MKILDTSGNILFEDESRSMRRTVEAALAAGCVLNDANLDRENLAHSNLSYGNFKGASFINADLSYTNLKNADFRNATLTGANLHGSTLRADFQGVKKGQ